MCQYANMIWSRFCTIKVLIILLLFLPHKRISMCIFFFTVYIIVMLLLLLVSFPLIWNRRIEGYFFLCLGCFLSLIFDDQIVLLNMESKTFLGLSLKPPAIVRFVLFHNGSICIQQIK